MSRQERMKEVIQSIMKIYIRDIDKIEVKDEDVYSVLWDIIYGDEFDYEINDVRYIIHKYVKDYYEKGFDWWKCICDNVGIDVFENIKKDIKVRI